MTAAVTQNSDKFQGWGAFDKDCVDKGLKWFEYEPKKFMDDDVEMDILYCGVCGTDVHIASSGWGDMSAMYPQVVGHEIVGKVTRLGDKVTNLKVGDVVGVGPQCDSCLECRYCKDKEENYCDKGQTSTYGGFFSRTCEGTKTYGGYADKWRGPAHFAHKIPDGLDPAIAAPMLCAGGTVYQPLIGHGAGKEAKDVGVIGIGGLGHYAVIFAHAMGAQVTAITHSESKVKEVKDFGASKVIVTHGDTDAAIKGHERTLDLIICTTSDPQMPLSAYCKLLRPHGNIVLVGISETASGIPSMHPFELMSPNVFISGSANASPQDLRDMLEWATTLKTKPWIKKYSMDDASQAIRDQRDGKARYRLVLVNEKNGGVM